MKKLLLLSLIAMLGTASTRADDPRSQREKLVVRVESCEAILQEFMADPATSIPPAVWQRAHGLIILNQFKAGFILGVRAGYGVILVKKPNGRWSVPVLIGASEASLGLQVGAKSVESVLIITDDVTPRLLYAPRFDVGVDAKAVAGPKAAEAEHFSKPAFFAPILVYSHSDGLFAGATVKAGRLARDDRANFALYNTTYEMPELLYSDWVTPPSEVQPLMNYVQRLAP